MSEIEGERNRKTQDWRIFDVTPHFAPGVFRPQEIICAEDFLQKSAPLHSISKLKNRPLSKSCFPKKKAPLSTTELETGLFVKKGFPKKSRSLSRKQIWDTSFSWRRFLEKRVTLLDHRSGKHLRQDVSYGFPQKSAPRFSTAELENIFVKDGSQKVYRRSRQRWQMLFSSRYLQKACPPNRSPN